MATRNRISGESSFNSNRIGGTAAQNVQQQVESLARQLADGIIREREEARIRSRNGRVYTLFQTADDVISNQQETVTSGLFSGNTGSLLTYFTSSAATAIQNTYYRAIHDKLPTDPTSQVQLAIAYGNREGSGSSDITGNLNNDTPSRAVYRQYAQILLPPNDTRFTINGSDTDSIYILNFNRARFRERLDPGNFEINLAALSGSSGVANGAWSNAGHTGSNVRLDGTGRVISIIDDSSTSLGTVGEAGLVYNLVSGSIDGGTVIHNASSPVYYGLLYPQHGIAILNANTLDANAGFETVSGSQVQGDNAMKLFTSLSGSGALTSAGRSYGIQARSSEQVKSTYYFVRVKNAEYNYSNNPSFTTGTYGDLRFATFINDPQSYITTVGLYNDRRELLAVAKLSQPIRKSFSREALIKVKLDF